MKKQKRKNGKAIYQPAGKALVMISFLRFLNYFYKIR